jgi:hypothetical protein
VELKDSLAQQTTESGKLEAECAQLRSALADAQAQAGAQDDEDLKYRIAGQYLTNQIDPMLTDRT